MALPYPTDIVRSRGTARAPAPGTFGQGSYRGRPLPYLGKMPRVPLPKGAINANFVTYVPTPLKEGRGALLPVIARFGGPIFVLGQAWGIQQMAQTGAAHSAYWNLSFCAGVNGGGYYESFFRTSCVTAVLRSALSLSLPTRMSSGWTLYDNGQFISGQWRHKSAIRAQIKSGVTYPKPTTYREYVHPEPVFRPIEAPEQIPIYKPMPVGKPKPWRRANPRPHEQPAQEPDPEHRPNPRRYAYPLPAFPTVPVFVAPTMLPRPGAEPVPVQPPDIVIDAGPNGRPRTRYRPRAKRPPKKYHKNHNKLTTKGVARGTQIVVGTITEVADFVESLHKALPKKYRARARINPRTGKLVPPSFKRQLGAVVAHFTQINPEDAVAHLVNNQIEDMAYGSMGREYGRGSRAFNVTTGLGRAAGAGGKFAQEANPDGGPPPMLQLVYDEETGRWQWGWD